MYNLSYIGKNQRPCCQILAPINKAPRSLGQQLKETFLADKTIYAFKDKSDIET